MTWWNNQYPFRRKLRVTAPVAGAPINHPVSCLLSKTNTVDMGKMNIDLSDLAVVYNNTQIGRQATVSSSDISVEFNLQVALTTNQVLDEAYYVYYGYPLANSQPVYTPNLWPLSVNYDGVGVSYTRPGEDWVDGVSEEKYAKATFIFSGSKVRVISDLSKSSGIAEIQIDNDNFVDVDLYNRYSLILQTVYERDDLAETDHVLRVRVSGRQNPASIGSKVNIVRFDYRRNVTASDLGEEINDFTWSSSLGGA